jgi:peptidoglycan L-alanyl-D-glutamate endopeptidase CwlK
MSLLPHSLGNRSKIQFDTLHTDLQTVIDWVLKYCLVDFTLTEGYRPVERQHELYKSGREFIDGRWKLTKPKLKKTNIDGYAIVGKHNHNPSLAVDFCVYVPDKPELIWDIPHLTYIAASLVMAGDFLFLQGVITHKVRWGGNWDKDGDLADNNFYDRPHVELYVP